MKIHYLNCSTMYPPPAALFAPHLDRDHAGGLRIFPNTKAHVLRVERDAAFHLQSRREGERRRPIFHRLEKGVINGRSVDI